MTTVRILGAIEVWDRERRVELGGPRQVSLLARLVLTPNRAVTSDVLIDALWRDGDVSGRKRLQMAVRRLRQTIVPVSGRERLVLETVAGGYLLRLERAELDSELFAAGVVAGQAALQAGEFERARECLREALSLWRGPPLAEVVFEDFAQPEIRRLEELRVSALESRIDADLQLGRDAELVSELEALVSEEPVRERLAGQLMTALYRCGRQADALDVYQRIRMHLAEQLGLQPGPALRELQTQILEQDAMLEFPPRAAPGAGGQPPGTGHAVSRPCPRTDRSHRTSSRRRHAAADADRSRRERQDQARSACGCPDSLAFSRGQVVYRFCGRFRPGCDRNDDLSGGRRSRAR